MLSQMTDASARCACEMIGIEPHRLTRVAEGLVEIETVRGRERGVDLANGRSRRGVRRLRAYVCARLEQPDDDSDGDNSDDLHYQEKP